MLYQATVRPIIDGTDRPGFDFDSVIAAGGQIPEFIETGFDADFSFDIPGEGAFLSRISPFALDRTGKSVSLQNNSMGRYAQLGAGMNGLVGPTLDAREMCYAVCYNYRAPSPADSQQILVQSSTQNSTQGGEALVINSGGSLSLQVRGYASDVSLSSARLAEAGLNLAGTTPFIICVVSSRILEGDVTEHTLMMGSQRGSISAVRTGTKALGGRNLAMGNAYNTNAGAGQMVGRFGRFMSGGRGRRTLTEMEGIYQRARVVAMRCGITVL